MKRTAKLIAAFAALAFSASALAAGARFVVVSHAPDADPFWNVVKNGIADAGKDFDVSVDYRNPPNGDLADMVHLLDQAAARNYDGVATTIADFDVVRGPVKTIVAKGIPVVTFNSGTAKQNQQLGGLLHVGQPEYLAGKEAGERAKAAGIKRFLCVNNNATNPDSFERCRGFAEAIGADFKTSTLDSGNDPIEVENKVFAALHKQPDTQAVLALGPTSAVPAMRAIQKLGLTGKIWFATFDMTSEVDKGIKAGAVKFAIDQQPYLQGYIPIALLALMKQEHTHDIQKAIATLQANPKFQQRIRTYGLTPRFQASGIDTGPGFVTQENVGLVDKYAGQYR
ncbi:MULTISPECIES: sugar ABC transporter substrate-binding protein [Paraburkholderia]|uniref:Simple sugar transport system substrate-binding protein n=2 Tax=Paraburkholderia TaxID=1822464 RepID=A0A7Z7BAC1_9BURK|nr:MULTISPECIES: sugar ABC transporter substrate-binding protein [Paraburkholderia]SDI40351.1 simple sugar transport system substrate-binding protein [Paraburkholderia steynii]